MGLPVRRRELGLALLIVGLSVPHFAAGSAVPLEPRTAVRTPALAGTDAAADAPCALSPEALALAEAIRRHPLQRRARLRCNAVLAVVAAEKAAEMARKGHVTHALGVAPPNRRLRKAGYRLPPSYPGMDANQVEAVAGGYATPQAALDAFLASPGHRSHLLAEHAFYAEQDEIGVGFARNRDTEHVDYWVVYIARRAPSRDPARALQATAGKPVDP